MSERLVAVTADGVRLAVHRFPAEGPRRGVLLGGHAMMASSGYLRGAFARHLAGAGIEAHFLDFRGHGASRPPDPRADDWCFDDYVRRDLPAAIAAVCEAAGIEPGALTYLGHSLGGLVGLAAFGTGTAPAPGRLALWATSVWLPGRRGPLARRAIMAAYAASTRLRGYAPIRATRLGSDDETRGYVEQLAGWARSGRWTARDGTDYLAALRRIEAPAWLVTGDGDRLCAPADAMVLGRRLSGALPLRRVGRAAGDALDPDHFGLFTREPLAPLWDELIAFVS